MSSTHLDVSNLEQVDKDNIEQILHINLWDNENVKQYISIPVGFSKTLSDFLTRFQYGIYVSLVKSSSVSCCQEFPIFLLSLK